MARIRITDNLTGTLAEAYYKEFCDQHGWAYISLEQIHERGIKKGILKFKKGFDRIYVKIPEEVIPEIEEISKPSNKSLLRPSYVYDFLACKIGKWKKPEALNVKERKDFCWVEVKSGMQDLSNNQVRTLKKITMPLYRFRVPYPLSESEDIEIFYDRVDSKFLFEHGLDSKVNIITIPNNSFKENMASFKKVSPEKFSEIKQGLKKLFKITQYQSNDPNIAERFEIVSLGAKFPVSYYKNGTLFIQGDESLDNFQRGIGFIKYSLENDS